MSNKKEDRKHPYMHTFNWTNGKLCFWRDNKSYSQKTKDYFEETVKRWVKEERNYASLKESI
jgi:hypothetical protein